MELEQFVTTFTHLCDDPRAWAIAGAASLKAVWSVFEFKMCPMLKDEVAPGPDEARRVVNARFNHSPRYLATMVLGIGLAVAGLYALTMPEIAPLGLAAMVVGVFLFSTEPSRLIVREHTLRVSAAVEEGPESLALAQDRLRGAHRERLFIEIGIAASLIAILLAF